MAKSDVETSRIRDVDRDSKILRDIPSRLHRKFDSFTSKLNRGLDGGRHHLQQNTHRVERDMPRQPPAWVCEVHNERKYSFREENKHRVRSKIPILSEFSSKVNLLEWIDTVESWFEETQPPENLKCKLAYYALEGEAKQWWLGLQQQRILRGESKITLWSRMKFLLINDFWPTICSTKCPLQVCNDRLGEKCPYYHPAEFSFTMEITATTTRNQVKPQNVSCVLPAKCLTEVLNESYIRKQEEVDDLGTFDESMIIDRNGSMETSEKSESSWYNMEGTTTTNQIKVKSLGLEPINLVDGYEEESESEQAMYKGTGPSVVEEFGVEAPIVRLPKSIGHLLKEVLKFEGSTNNVQKSVLQDELGLKLVESEHKTVLIGDKSPYVDATILFYLSKLPTSNLLFRYVILHGENLLLNFDHGGVSCRENMFVWMTRNSTELDIGENSLASHFDTSVNKTLEEREPSKHALGFMDLPFQLSIITHDNKIHRPLQAGSNGHDYKLDQPLTKELQLMYIEDLDSSTLKNSTAMAAKTVEESEQKEMNEVKSKDVKETKLQPTVMFFRSVRTVLKGWNWGSDVVLEEWRRGENGDLFVYAIALGITNQLANKIRGLGEDLLSQALCNGFRRITSILWPITITVSTVVALPYTFFLSPYVSADSHQGDSPKLRFLLSFLVHMAIVFNEYGGTTWIVTLDDVLKEIDSGMEEFSQRLQALPLAIGSRKSQYTTGARVAIERLILAEYEVKLTATNVVEYENASTCKQALKHEFIMFFGNSIAQSRKKTAEMKLSLPVMPIIFFYEADQVLATDGLHTLNSGLMFHVTISFDPGGIPYSSKTRKPVSSIRKVHLFQCSFLDVAAPNGTFGVGFENGFVPSIISHEDCMANSFSMCFGLDGRRIFNFDDTGVLLRQIRKSIGQMNDHVEDKKMELQEMVIATFMAVLSAYSMWNQIENFCDMVLNMEKVDGDVILRSPGAEMLGVLSSGFQFLWNGLYTEDSSICPSSNPTQGRVISWEGWDNENYFNYERNSIMAVLTIVTMFLCLSILFEDGKCKKTLKVFFKLVNGLDPPNDETTTDWHVPKSFNVADLTRCEAPDHAPTLEESLEDEFILLGEDGDDVVNV